MKEAWATCQYFKTIDSTGAQHLFCCLWCVCVFKFDFLSYKSFYTCVYTHKYICTFRVICVKLLHLLVNYSVAKSDIVPSKDVYGCYLTLVKSLIQFPHLSSHLPFTASHFLYFSYFPSHNLYLLDLSPCIFTFLHLYFLFYLSLHVYSYLSYMNS